MSSAKLKMNDIAILHSENFLKELSVLQSSSIVLWKKNRNLYNFKHLPKTAIISVSKNSVQRNVRFFSKKIKGIVGCNYIISKNVIFCSEFGSGSPAIIGILEELRELGVENFIFAGPAGTISKTVELYSTFIVDNSFSTAGCTSFYSNKDNFEPSNSLWFQNLHRQLDLPNTICWSTDAPFRETKSLINHFVEKMVTHVDMECAAIYAFAKFYNVNALCCIVSADDLSTGMWMPPQNAAQVNLNLKQLISKLIKIVK